MNIFILQVTLPMVVIINNADQSIRVPVDLQNHVVRTSLQEVLWQGHNDATGSAATFSADRKMWL